jgi:hypothetical protein
MATASSTRKNQTHRDPYEITDEIRDLHGRLGDELARMSWGIIFIDLEAEADKLKRLAKEIETITAPQTLAGSATA